LLGQACKAEFQSHYTVVDEQGGPAVLDFVLLAKVSSLVCVTNLTWMTSDLGLCSSSAARKKKNQNADRQIE